MIFVVFDTLSLGFSLAARNLSAKYRQNFASFIWAFVQPAIVTLSFVMANKIKLINTSVSDVPYPLFAFIGSTMWSLASDCLEGPTLSLLSAKPFLTKVKFNRSAIIIAQICEICVQFGLRFMLVGVLLAYYGYSLTLSGFASSVVFCLCIILVCSALGMLFGPFHMLFQDLYNMFKIVMSYGLFLVPAIYKIPGDGVIVKMLNENPIAFLIVGARDGFLHPPSVSWSVVFLSLILSMVVFVIGFRFFSRSVPHIIDRLV